MRVGDKIRFLQVGLLGTLVPTALLGGFAWASERMSVWWGLAIGLACAPFAIWAGWTFFGITHLERLAARIAHGGRHYYFEHEEIRVMIDDFDDAWIRLADLRRCIGGAASGVRHYHPTEATRIKGGGRHAYLSVAGVRRYLGTTRHADKQKFSLWFERDLVAPFERRRDQGLPLHGTGSGRI